MMHEARADFCMLLGSIYLLLEGGGAWSLDALWFTSGSSRDDRTVNDYTQRSKN
jgi:hypothetical protein